MPENVPFDESSPFFVPSPTTTASNLRRIVEEIQERKRILDSQLLSVLPNLVSSYVLKTCESQASMEGMSTVIRLSPSDLVKMLPSKVTNSLVKNCDTHGSCSRILKPLGESVAGILLHLGFKVLVTSTHIMDIEISW
jgi:hypothetical protein